MDGSVLHEQALVLNRSWAAIATTSVREALSMLFTGSAKAIRPETYIRLEPMHDVPPLVPEQDGAAEALVRRLTGDNATNVVSYGTEAGHFQNAGMSTVICGPGDIAQAHQPDEFLTLDQFDKGWAFMEALVDDLCQ